MKARIPLILTAVLFLAGTAFFILKSQSLATVSPPSIKADKPMEASSPIKPLADLTLGNDEAPHTLITYFAPSCPHCSQYEIDDFPKVEENFVKPGKIRVVFRIVPLNELDFFVARLCYSTPDTLKNLMLFLKNQEKWLKPTLEKGDEKTKLFSDYEKTVAEKLGIPVSALQESLKKEMESKNDFRFLMLFALDNGFSMEAVKKAALDDHTFDNSLAMGTFHFKRRNGDDINEVPFFSLNGFDVEGLATADVLEKQLRFLQKL
jgi:hypothetical protein